MKVRSEKYNKFLTALFLYQKTYFLAKSYWRHLLIFLENTDLLSSKREGIFMLLTGLLCGILLGFVMQRGRFCITGAFRDMYVTKNNKMFVALLLAITVQSIGFFLLKEIGVLNVDPAENFAFLAVIIGAFVFGIGIVLAGGCATGYMVSCCRRLSRQLGCFIHLYVVKCHHAHRPIRRIQ